MLCPNPIKSISILSLTAEKDSCSNKWRVRKEKNQNDASQIHNERSGKQCFAENAAYHVMIRLPLTFRPGPYDVICGRGKDVIQHPGNRRYRELINSNLRNYVETTSKLEKTLLVTSIIKRVEDASSEGGGFVKNVNGVWYKVSECYAREKCGQSIRDALHTEYRSSSRAKSGRRKLCKKQSLHRNKKDESQGNEQLNNFIECAFLSGMDNQGNHNQNEGLWNPMNIKLVSDDMASSKWSEANRSHLRNLMILPGSGVVNKSVASLSNTPLTMEEWNLVSISPEGSHESSFVFRTNNRDDNKWMLDKYEFEDPEGLDWMVKCISWDD